MVSKFGGRSTEKNLNFPSFKLEIRQYRQFIGFCKDFMKHDFRYVHTLLRQSAEVIMDQFYEDGPDYLELITVLIWTIQAQVPFFPGQQTKAEQKPPPSKNLRKYQHRWIQ